MHSTLLRRISASLWGFAVCYLAGAWSPVAAQSVPTFAPSVTYVAGGGTITGGSLNQVGTGFRSWAANTATQGEVLIADAVTSRIGSANAAMYANRVLPFAGVAKVAARALPYVGAGLLIYELFKTFRCTAGGSGGVVCDDGQAPGNSGLEFQAYQNNDGGLWHPTRDTACAATNFTLPGQTLSGSHFDPGSGNCIGTLTVGNNPPNSNFSSGGLDQRPAAGCVGGGAIGIDGKCGTGNYHAVSDDEAASRFQTYAPPVNAPQVAQDAAAKGVDLAPYTVPAPLPFSGPATATDPTPETRINPSTGLPEQVYNRHDITYTPNGYTYRDTATTTPPSTTPTTGTTPTEITTCGLPGTPACKIDESGTPDKVDDATAKIDDAAKDSKKVAETPDSIFPAFPSLAWNFALPSICVAVPTPAFEPFFTQMDLCQFKPVFDDLMSVVWLFGGLFGAIQLFLRDALAA